MNQTLKKWMSLPLHLQTGKDGTPVGIILGTGLGISPKSLRCRISAYDEIPHFPLSTVESHAGRLIFGAYPEKRGRHARQSPLL